MNMPVRLEVNTGTDASPTWVDVLGSTNSIATGRSPLNLGTLTANLANVALDPATSTTLSSGRPIRLTALTSGTTTFTPVWTGKIATAKVTYPRPEPGADPNKAARIEIAAVDPMQPLGTIVEPRSVHTTTNLRTLLAASGLPWRVNGTTTAGPASPLVVANNPTATLADQVAITRDTVRGWAWVDAAGVLQVYDPASMPTGLAATYSDTAGAALSYASVETSYDSTDVVDEVSVTFLVYKVAAGAVEEVTHTLRRPGATGTNTRSYTVVGPSMSAAEIKAYCEAYAQGVLDRNASAVVRPLSMSTPVRTTAERAAARAAEPCSKVRVVVTGRVDAQVRIESVEHNITAVSGVPDPVQWVATYTYGPPDAVPEAQTLSIVRAAPIQDRLAAAEVTAAEGVDPAATAERLTGQVITGAEVRSADDGPQWVVGATGSAQRIEARSGEAEEVSPGGVEIVVGTSTLALSLEAPSLPSSLTPSIDLVQRRSTGVSEVVATANRVLANAPVVDLAGEVGTGAVGTGTFRDSVTAAARADRASLAVTATSPFTADATVTRLGSVYVLTGTFSRASGSSASFVTAGTIGTASFRPPVEIVLPACPIFNTTALFQVVLRTTGAIDIRMSGASAAALAVNAVWAAA